MLFNRAKIFVFSLVLCLALGPTFVQAKDEAPLSYENVEMGVKINCPDSWFITPGDKVQQALAKGIADLTSTESLKEAIKRVGVLVMFSQYQFGSPIEYNPNVALVTEPLSGSYIDNAMDYANASLMNIKTMFKDIKVLVDPKMIKLSGKDAAHFVYEGTMVRGYLEIRMKSSVYLFVKDKLGYTLTCTDKLDNFNNNAAKFEKAVNSLEIK